MNYSRHSDLIHQQAAHSICAPWLLALLLAVPAAVQAQFTYATINGTITITRYAGPGGAVTIPDTITGLPVTTIGQYAFDRCTTLTSVTIPDSVTSIGYGAFEYSGLTSLTLGTNLTSIGGWAFCDTGLTSVTIPDSVTSIGDGAFVNVESLNSVTIGTSVTNIGGAAFAECDRLTSVTIPDRVTSIGQQAFEYCFSLRGVYFKGNAPSVVDLSFYGDNNATVYYLPGATGWTSTFGGLPTALWEPPGIQRGPQTQTAEAGSAVGLGVTASGTSPLFCWYFNNTNLIICSTNCPLQLTNLQFAQSGTYAVVVTNGLGAATSSPAMLQVIAPVERRPVPGVKVMGQPGSLWDVVCSDSLSPAPNWTLLGSVSLGGTPHCYFDLTQPLPRQRFYRAHQPADPAVLPILDLHMVPAISVTGTVGSSVRLDIINRFGPIGDWVTLATVTLTNTSQPYFDISAPGQPQRLYRLVPLP